MILTVYLWKILAMDSIYLILTMDFSLRNHWASRMVWLMASISRNISAIIYSNMPLSRSLSSRNPIKYIFNLLTLFSMTLSHSSIFFIFYYFFSAFWIISSDLFSSSLILSLTVSDLLLNTPTTFFKSAR